MQRKNKENNTVSFLIFVYGIFDTRVYFISTHQTYLSGTASGNAVYIAGLFSDTAAVDKRTDNLRLSL